MGCLRGSKIGNTFARKGKLAVTLNFFVLSASSRVSLGDFRKKPPLNDDIRECGEWEMRKVSPFPRSEGALRRESGRAIRRLFGFLRPTTEGTRNADSILMKKESDQHQKMINMAKSENDQHLNLWLLMKKFKFFY